MAATWDKESLLRAIKTDPKFHFKCPTLAEDIVAHRLSLVVLIENLKDLLTDPEPSQRAKGLNVLSSVLNELPADFLRGDELQFIVAFFCDRLKDHHDVIPAALKGIRAILKMKTFSSDLPLLILRSIMLNVNCQTSPQEERLLIYQILDLLIIPHLESLRTLGPDLVLQVISTIEGEQDPRNLKFLFAMLPSMLREVPLGPLTEDVFDALACYFPVDYNPSPEDHGEITREDLARALNECLSAIPAFSNFCITLALEKIGTPLRVAKQDSLYLLMNGFRLFHAMDVAMHLSPIWMSLSREALASPDSEIRESARECVTYLLRCLSNLPLVNGQQPQPMLQLLSDVVSAAMSSLSDLHASLFSSASELLLSAAKSSTVTCEHILVKVMPQVVDSCRETEGPTDRSIYLRFISKFLVICKPLKVTPQDIPDISKQWTLLVQLYFTSAEHVASLLRKEALFGLSILVPTLNDNERLKLYNLLCTLVDEETSVDVREETMRCLYQCAFHQPSEVVSLIAEDKLLVSDLESNDRRYARRLEAHCCLAAFEVIGEKILSNILNLVITSRDSSIIRTTLISLRKLLDTSKSDDNFVIDCLEQHCSFTNRIIHWWVECVCSVEQCEWVKNEEIINEVSHVISVVTRSLSEDLQKCIVRETLPELFPGRSIKPCEISSPLHHNLVVALLEALLGSFYPSVFVPDTHSLCCALVKLAVHCHHPSVVLSASRLCANIINKQLDATILNKVLEDISETLDKSLQPTVEEQDAVRAAAMYGWLIRSLAMRGHISLESWMSKLSDILGDSRKEVSLSAAMAFKTIMLDSGQFLNQENHCTSRLLFKQRVFEGGLKFVSRAREKHCGERSSYLYAHAYLLMDVPASVLACRVAEVAPLLLETLSQESMDLLELGVRTFHSLLLQPTHSNLLKDHIQSLVPRLLQLIAYNQSMQIRSCALLCLYEISHFPSQLLLPFKDEVCCKLLVCLDDKKRLVRKDAVKARTSWLMVGAL